MTDITELAQRMKAAAVRAKTATEEYASGHMSVSVCFSECEEFNRLTDGPDNILALVEALEKAQVKNALVSGGTEATAKLHERITELESEVEKWKQESESWERVAERQLATAIELESRTVKLPEPFKLAKSSSGLTYYYADEVDAALTAAGIKVEAE
ncbi:RelE family toxin-antitoxin system [Klebsiella pneumoniae]|uniref:hypothetical protein n=1 Tax=Klebsiella pneumoniae TaxID=573 RepID=UPI000E2C9BA5|nr:hypothetical protein [Klebsiella pneumoniae]SWS75184.1 RelE family toxin-antitoxin system [Klebsiella pneumoniae]